MFKKVNYDIIAEDDVYQFRGAECFGGYTHENDSTGITNFKKHKAVIYIPEFFYATNFSTLYSSNYHTVGYKGYFTPMGSKTTEEKVLRWAEWLKLFGIPVVVLESIQGNDDTLIECRIKRGLMPDHTITKSIDPYSIYRYELDLSKASSVAEAKFYLFMSRYFSLDINQEIIDFAFKFKDENPDIPEWDCFVFAEFMATRIIHNSHSEYYIFSRKGLFTPYISFESYKNLNWNKTDMDLIQKQVLPSKFDPYKREFSNKAEELGNHINLINTTIEKFNYWKQFNYEL